MTDNEIVKAFEFCFKGKKCDKCLLNDGKRSVSECLQYLCENTLDLINRLQGENEIKTMDVNSLTSERDALQEMVIEQKAEIERLKSDLTLKTYDYEHLLMKCKEIQAISSSRKDRLMQTVVKLQTAKSEARKEIAEMIIREYPEADYFISNLVKEMEGEIVENQKWKMVEATVSELFENYLKCGYDDIMSFYDYKNQCEYFGLKITKEKENEKK